MIRRALKVILAVLCLLSLLLCLGTAWLWSRVNHGVVDRITLAGAGYFVDVSSRWGKLHVTVVRRWPGLLVFRAASAVPRPGWNFRDLNTYTIDSLRFAAIMEHANELDVSGHWGWFGWYDTIGQVELAPDGTPVRDDRPGEFPTGGRMSPVLPVRKFDPLPYAWPVSVFAVPPLLWLGAAGIRAVFRRRRRAKGLCLRCRYDLTGNVSGKCPECGTATRRDGEAT